MPANAANDPDNSDLFIQDDTADPLSGAASQEPAPWRILIVDDDVDVHVVTKFALSNTQFQGRRLSFLHAYSGAEAITLLQQTPDIAMVLLDVIMETPDAGLLVARQIRGELANDSVRIVLRTGQPGQALEHSIIVDYDINDFWCKADLTTRKLFTTVISSLRAYATLQSAAAQRAELDAELTRVRKVQEVLERNALVITFDAQGRIIDANDFACHLAQIRREDLLGRDLHALHPRVFPAALAREIQTSLARDSGWAGDITTTTPSGESLDLRCATLAFKDSAGVPYQYAAVATRRNPAD